MLFIKLIKQIFAYLYTNNWKARNKISISKILILSIRIVCNNEIANISIKRYNQLKVANVSVSESDQIRVCSEKTKAVDVEATWVKIRIKT